MPDPRYRIIDRVAAGGMAEVFRGVAESLQGFKKNIAIKRILPSLTKNKKFVAMFLDEARLSLSLQHTNIVQVFDIGRADDTYFIVMEYVDGVDLKGIVEWRRKIGKRISIAQSLYIMMEVCKGLAYAHELTNPDTGRPVGIVHRDISPPNILISKQGEVKVVDFGLAKASSQVENTDPGVVKGKMSYLSPEAAMGKEVDHRSDIFATGIILYELLTGKRLFFGETDYQTVELIRKAKIPPIRAQNPDVETELEDIVRKSLARRLEDRFQSATDLQDALAQYMFSRGLKVIARDIAELVRTCLDEKLGQSGSKGKLGGNIIDRLLQDEITKFSSVDFEDPGAQPLLAEEMPAGPPEGGFIDPRSWSMDFSQPIDVSAGGQPRRPTAARPVEAPAGPRSTAARPTASRPTASRPAAGTRSTPRAVEMPPGPSPRPSRPELTPGPEALANILEPEAAPGAVQKPAKSGRKLLIGMLIGVLLLGFVSAAMLMKILH